MALRVTPKLGPKKLKLTPTAGGLRPATWSEPAIKPRFPRPPGSGALLGLRKLF